MTVCAAAIYTIGHFTNGPKRAIMGISDRMITSGDGIIEYEPKKSTRRFLDFQFDQPSRQKLSH
jgi:hypothetical protein